MLASTHAISICFTSGKGNWAFEHLYDTSETRKTQRLAEIKAEGRQPRIDILVHGLSEDEAFRIESVCIDLISLDRLTNLLAGHSAAWGSAACAADH